VPKISIIIPLYNEAESLPHLKETLDRILAREKLDAELLFVNDGSTDSSREQLDRFAESDPRVRVIMFRRNYGKSAAVDAGFRSALGEYVITMDADLQDDPEEIPNLIAKLEEGYDLVSGWKKKRYDPLSKKIPSRIFNWSVRIFSGIRLHDFNCGLKIYRRQVLETIRVYGELHRFIPMLVAAQGWRVGELIVQHHPRQWGTTKFGISRFVGGMLDLMSVLFITRFKTQPMHLFGSFGLFSMLIGLVILLYLTISWFLGVPIGQRPLFFLGILLVIVGIQFFSIGLIGELISHSNEMNQLQTGNKKQIEEPE